MKVLICGLSCRGTTNQRLKTISCSEMKVLNRGRVKYKCGRLSPLPQLPSSTLGSTVFHLAYSTLFTLAQTLLLFNHIALQILNMHLTALTFSSLLAATVLATASPRPYKLGTTSFNKALGLSKRQDSGYQPTQNFCGSGDTCAEACGAGYITCDSTVDEGSHCFNPDQGETCCPNLSGGECPPSFEQQNLCDGDANPKL